MVERRRAGEVLWSTGRTARFLGVGPTTVQRWANEGRLPAVRTAGGHRRFRPGDVEILRRSLDSSGAAAAVWADLLVSEGNAYRLQAALLGARARCGSWARVADEIGDGLDELGRRWQRQECSIYEEHLASERLARALARCSESIPVAEGTPRCLLITAEGEDHTLGLSLVELVLRESGWRCDWLGRQTPLSEVVRALDGLHPSLVGVSASARLDVADALRPQYERLAALCRERRIGLLLGGQGAWPDAPEFGDRLDSLEDLPRVLEIAERECRREEGRESVSSAPSSNRATPVRSRRTPPRT